MYQSNGTYSDHLEKYNKFMDNNKHSLTHLDGLSGSVPLGTEIGSSSHKVDINMGGAEFKNVEYKTPYYEYTITERIVPPWLGLEQEKTFMNYIKDKNEPEVKTYKNIKLNPVSTRKYESYKPIINTTTERYKNIEAFDLNPRENQWNNIMKIIIVILLIYYLYYIFTSCTILIYNNKIN